VIRPLPASVLSRAMHPFVSRAFVVVVVVRDTQSPTRVTPRAHPRRSARASSSTIYWRSRKGYTEYQRTVCTTCGICCGANRTNQYPFLSYPWCVVQRDRADGRARVSWTVRSVGRSGVSHLYAHTSTPSVVKYGSHVHDGCRHIKKTLKHVWGASRRVVNGGKTSEIPDGRHMSDS
jgi:hypothetical protein